MLLLILATCLFESCQPPNDTGTGGGDEVDTHYIELTISVPSPMNVPIMDISWGDFEGLASVNNPTFPYHYTIHTNTKSEHFEITSYALEGSYYGTTEVDTTGAGPFTASYTLHSNL